MQWIIFRGLLTNAYEIHGDRHYVDDHAIVCYLGFIGTKSLVIGEQKVEEQRQTL